MFSRKQQATQYQIAQRKCEVPRTEESSHKGFPLIIISPQFRFTLFIVSTFSVWWLVLSWLRFSPATIYPKKLDRTPTSLGSVCHVSVYMYQLPTKFNMGLITNCTYLNVYTNMCSHVVNCGLGQPMAHMGPTGWFATHQFVAEMIFHARVENHPCRTWDPAAADLFYLPFYGGLHVSSKFKEANHTARDELAVQVVSHVTSQPWWQRNHGKDHFMVLGRTAWDFMRTPLGPDFGANTLLNLPAVRNMSVLTVERQPWDGPNQYGIPYPSYFHPSNAQEIATWQEYVKKSQRPYLFSFVGGPRKGVQKAQIRDELIAQCDRSSRCNLIRCGTGTGAGNCHDPGEVIRVMSRSRFCLQAPGDSFTRRSTFDSILAGCIPVFFSPHTAYTQYAWYLPQDRDEYSVYVDEEEVKSGVGVEEVLSRIGKEKAERMRVRVIELIPRVTYGHPNRSDDGPFLDAVDVALLEVGKLVQSSLNYSRS